ncbi:hypothetical protein [Mycolicibacterium novocastrense]|nr:hypothetical protein [Mycolicibacterium novocastrense]
MTARRDNTSAPPAGARDTAQRTWKALAPLMAARPTMRIWGAEHRFDKVRPLTRKLPEVPAAVPLYNRGRTRLLALDLDAKKHGRERVSDDRDRLLSWIADCGARAIVDTSTSGGAHILVPLTVAVTVEQIKPLMAALAAVCRTLDVTPMLNPAQGCLTAPGSPCREGGYRVLVGDLGDAEQLLRTRNPPQLLDLLAAQLAATNTTTAPASPPQVVEYFTGSGHHQSLAPRHRLHSPMPAAVTAFARTGVLPSDGRWPSRSEARQAVLTHAMWRGATLADIHRLAAPGQAWTGLSAAYERYGAQRHKALERDWDSAQRWLVATIPRFQTATHKKQHTGGRAQVPAQHRRWLAHAVWWCDLTLRSHPQRWAAAAVLQALAISSVRAGELVQGVPVVAVGGRSLSIAAGLLSESTAWAVLRALREMPGAPILLVAKGTGLHADRYALTTPDVCDPHPDAPGRPAVADVHHAWSVIGLQHRRLYETVITTGLDNPRDLAGAARTSISSTYNSIAELARIGLLRRQAGRLTPGETTLDDIAEQHRLAEARSARIAAHQAARIQWQAWLATRQIPPIAPPVDTGTVAVAPPATVDVISEADYLSAVMATGPPAALVP